MPTITDLPQIINSLTDDQRRRFERIFDTAVVAGETRIPETMKPWVEQHLGRVEEIEHQRIIRMTNRVTLEGAIFNPIRANRPLVLRPLEADHQPTADDIFADPLRTTAEDVFGRVRGKYCITTSNVARWDGQCAVLIFDEYDPLRFTREHIRDYFATALEWARRANSYDPEARNFVWMWNGGLKGGASVPHAHAQMGLGRRMPYAFVERLRLAAATYRAQYGSDYFADLLAAHEDIGLGFSAGSLSGFAYLAANRAKDVWIYGSAFDDNLANALYEALHSLIERTGTGAFNAGVIMPPLFLPPEGREARDEGENVSWLGFPVILRIGDRGAPEMLSSDVGAMDLYGHNVIAADPYHVQAALRNNR